MRRRLLAVVGTGITVTLAGCLAGAQSRGAPAYDCSDADRPEPTGGANPGEDTVESVPYPTRPEPLSESAAIEYVETYERAYRQNSLVERKGERLRDWGMSVDESRQYDAPESAAVVNLRYTYHAASAKEVEDSPVIYVSYYLDDEVVIRAESDTVLDAITLQAEAPHPDPWEEGEPLECFG